MNTQIHFISHYAHKPYRNPKCGQLLVYNPVKRTDPNREVDLAGGPAGLRCRLGPARPNYLVSS